MGWGHRTPAGRCRGPDAARGDLLYLGRSVDLRARILAHLRDGRPVVCSRGFIIRLADDAVGLLDVAEQLLIDSCGGGVGRGGSLANRIDAINQKRWDQLAALGATLIGLLGG